jgi:hypothetical protein
VHMYMYMCTWVRLRLSNFDKLLKPFNKRIAAHHQTLTWLRSALFQQSDLQKQNFRITQATNHYCPLSY